MPNVLTVKANGVRVSEREKLVRYGVRLSGSYVQHARGAATGEVLNLNGAGNASGQPGALWGGKGPDSTYVTNVGESGYSLSIVPGADALHPLLVIYSNVATELSAGAYPAALLADLDITIESSGRSFD